MNNIDNSDNIPKNENQSVCYHHIDEAKVKKEENERLRIKIEAAERNADRKAMGKAMKAVVILAVLAAFLAMLVSIKNRPGENECRVPSSADDYIGLNYERVKNELNSAGFRKITTKSQDDLLYNATSKVNTVSSVSINGDSNFRKNAVFSKDAKIIISFHSTGKRTAAPGSAEEYIGRNYKEVVEAFCAAGFTDVKVNEIPDVRLGLRVKEGTVETVSVKGSLSFQHGDIFNRDDVVVISYHAKRTSDKGDSSLQLDENMISVPKSAKGFRGEYYAYVKQDLEDAGFTVVITEPRNDLQKAGSSKDGKVDQISIGGNTEFKAGDVFGKDTTIRIRYHSYTAPTYSEEEIEVPESAKDYCNEHFRNVETIMQDLGFVDIELEPKNDLNKPDDKKEGKVEQISIGGNSEFEAKTVFNKNQKVWIQYHSFTKPELNDGEILIPEAAKYYRGKNAENVKLMLEDLGFIDIRLVPLNDLKKEGDKKEGAVSEISIQGDTDFKAEKQFKDTAVITIKYHSYQPQPEDSAEQSDGILQKAGEWIGGFFKKK